jgi:putative two-component system response regulator
VKVLIADVYDALTTRRVYKNACSHTTARELTQEKRGKHFDPAVADAFAPNEETCCLIPERRRDAPHSDQPPSSRVGRADRLPTA